MVVQEILRHALRRLSVLDSQIPNPLAIYILKKTLFLKIQLSWDKNRDDDDEGDRKVQTSHDLR
jgi:hypothetical protein